MSLNVPSFGFRGRKSQTVNMDGNELLQPFDKKGQRRAQACRSLNSFQYGWMVQALDTDANEFLKTADATPDGAERYLSGPGGPVNTHQHLLLLYEILYSIG